MAARAKLLASEARMFASKLKDLLNGTVTTHVTIGARTDDVTEESIVGPGIKGSETSSQPFQLQGCRAPIWLDPFFRLRLNSAGRLTVEQSLIYLRTGTDRGPEPDGDLLHLDYERGKQRYTAAHLQIHATSPAWQRVLPAKKPLHKIHVPVGGVRFRPTLEDLIEMLITEHIVTPNNHDTWRGHVERSRSELHAKQLYAAVLRDPDTARAALAEHGRRQDARS
jgi:hypothetical protein